MPIRRPFSTPFLFAVILSGAIGTAASLSHQHQTDLHPADQSQARATCAAGPPRDISMFVPLAHAARFGDAMLNLNSRSSAVQTVQPIWYVQGRGRVAGEPFTVPPTSISFPSIRQFLPPHVELSSVNGLELTYSGKPRAMWAQVTLLGRPAGGPQQSLDTVFNMVEDYRSSRLDAVWVVRGQTDRATIVLANTSDRPLEVHVQSDASQRVVHLNAHDAEVLTLPSPPSVDAAGIRLQSDGLPGALRATGYVASGGKGRARLIRFYDPAAAAQEKLFATGLRVRNVRGALALRNTSDDSITATPEFLDPDSGAPVFFLPPVSIPAHGQRAVNLEPLFSAGLASDRVAIEIANTGQPGSLIGTVEEVDLQTGMSYELPLRDSGGLRSSTGSYPWRLDDDFQTRVTITNIGNGPATFAAHLKFAGGTYSLGIRKLERGATATFDVRALRDAQQPDAFGSILPAGAESGQFYWSIRDSFNAGARFSGRSEIVSVKHQVASSYSCALCCPDSFGRAWVAPDSVTIDVDQTTAVSLYAEYDDCYGNSQSYAMSGSGWSYNTSIASIFEEDGWVYVRGLDGGSTNATTQWTDYVYTDTSDWCSECEAICVEQSVSAQASMSVQVRAAAYPVNIRINQNIGNNPFIHNGSTSGLPYILYGYAFDSSSGDLADLGQCEVWEQVNYSPSTWPLPPFHGGPSSISAKMEDGTVGSFVDQHTTAGPMLKDGPVFVSATVTGTQRFKWKCANIAGGAFQDFSSGANAGPHDIVRSVMGSSNDWSFTVTKHGQQATCLLNPDTGFCH